MDSHRELAIDAAARTEESELLSVDEGVEASSPIRRGSWAIMAGALLLAFLAGAAGGSLVWNKTHVGQPDVQAKPDVNQAESDIDGAIEMDAPAPAPCPLPNTLAAPPGGKIWRGSTNLLPSQYQQWFGQPLNVWRIFTLDPFDSTTLDFVKGGGIMFISPQITNWAADNTALMTNAIKLAQSIAPSIVYIAFGYEPDGHCNETANSPGEVYGTAPEWVSMQQQARGLINSMGATNVRQVIDFSTDMPMDFQPAATILWPGNEYVDLLCMNIFQNETTTNCGTAMELVYKQFEAATTATLNYTGVPWCLGAWGTMYQNHAVPTPEPIQNRDTCFTGMSQALNSGDYSRIILQNYFNSNACIVQPSGTPLTPSNAVNSPDLVTSYKNFLDTAVFDVCGTDSV